MALIRINRALAAAGLCSRRKADDLVLAGLVAVNGVPVPKPGFGVDPLTDKVSVRGRDVDLSSLLGEGAYTCLMLHKPAQVVSTVSDPQGRPTVMDSLPGSLREKRLYPVGRLDYFSEGLILLTDDGALTNRLTHPRRHLPRIYRVALRETPDAAALELMRRGMTLSEGETLLPAQVKSLAPNVLEITLRQGVNRQIRRMCRDLGLTILSLCRTGFGPLRLGDLARGACRPLKEEELEALRAAAGMPGASGAG
ncbi:MAG: rRNA pseudouridine synthase [Desulfovibrio sp.]|jgi:23S rRNA pseudouridine2605 synthase|nr:rRNA pseudouridine synthase [Desulfovibrio sp.]